ncbi:MAG: zinc ABC transporter substrate-binding protein [Campylobacterota bacterium]|nr:zinc ABC transporter substrate-binding protein [Campylobacterota bacterium]
MKKALGLIIIVLIILLALLSYQKSTQPSKIGSDTVVTTIYPLYFITKSIAGDAIQVKRLIKPGSEIHSFSPTPADMVELNGADLLITLGKDLEPWVGKLATATNLNMLSLEDDLKLIRNGEEHHHDHAEHDHGSHAKESHSKGGINPHVWLDFDNDIKMIEVINRQLCELYPDQSALFEKNAKALAGAFEKLERAYSDGLKECKQHTLLVGHDAFGYLEKRYGFETKSIMGVFAHSRPDAAKIAKLSKMIKAKELRYLFADPIESSKSAFQLARDMHLKLEPLHTLGNISLKDEQRGEDMMTLLYFDLKQFRKGLECP